MLSRRAAIVFGIADLVTAAVIALGVFAGLPSRWAAVDVPALAVIAADVGAAVGLLAAKPWAAAAARASSALSLALGLALVTTLALTASWLSGVYGPVGMGGAVVLALVAALALPYLVVLPVVRLVWLRGAGT
jgi:hypothetical protein